MVFFFAVMTKEVVEATAPGGVLHSWRRVLMPVIASFGVALVPALIHLALVEPLDEPMLGVAWPVTLATDVAVCYLAARLIFGRWHAAIPFAILLAIASDAIGFVALALLSPNREPHWTAGLLILLLAIGGAIAFRRLRLRSFWPYLVGPGAVAWFALYWSGLHPALSLVLIVPFLPHAARDPGFFVDASPDAKDTLSQFEVFWRYPAQVALFFFGLVNAGVPLRTLEQGTWALPIAVLVGKPAGILLGAGVAVLAGLRLPHHVELARLDRDRMRRGDRLQRRAVLLRRVDPAWTDSLGNQHGRPADRGGAAAGPHRREAAWRRAVRSLTRRRRSLEQRSDYTAASAMGHGARRSIIIGIPNRGRSVMSAHGSTLRPGTR